MTQPKMNITDAAKTEACRTVSCFCDDAPTCADCICVCHAVAATIQRHMDEMEKWKALAEDCTCQNL